MVNPPTARRHHYIPRCYLKRFANSEGQLFVLDGSTKRKFTTAIGNVAAEKDFLRLDVPGVAADALENQMSKFEGEVENALARVTASRSFRNPEDRIAIFNLMSLMAVRNPTYREQFQRHNEKKAYAAMEKALATRESWEAIVGSMKREGTIVDVSYEDMKARFNKNDYAISVPTMMHIQNELSTHDKILPTFFERKWAVLRARSGAGTFITSDRPVCLTWHDPAKRAPNSFVRFEEKMTDLIFPLSSQIVLLGRFEGEDSQHDLDAVQIAGLNGAQIDYANRQIFASPDDSFMYLLDPAERPKQGTDLLEDFRFTTPLGQPREGAE
jgi:hypothetical protein